jgi:hypothetical protein
LDAEGLSAKPSHWITNMQHGGMFFSLLLATESGVIDGNLNQSANGRNPTFLFVGKETTFSWNRTTMNEDVAANEEAVNKRPFLKCLMGLLSDGSG